MKICGITRVEDALAAACAGADAIGLNFFAGSKRCVVLAQAQRIAASVPDLLKVGVFVNANLETILHTVRHVGLDAVQLHGDEPPELIAALADAYKPEAQAKGSARKTAENDDLGQIPSLALPARERTENDSSNLPVIRACRVAGSQGLAPVAELLKRCQQAGGLPSAVLVDAHVAGEYGGTGLTADWSALAASRDQIGDTPLILAGGLTPLNVAAAIAAVRPFGVDTASGVESSPGIKDSYAIEAFVTAALTALASSG